MGDTMQRVLVCLISAIGLTCSVSVALAADKLKGSYAFTGTASCLFAPGSFPGAVPLPNPTPGTALPNSGFDGSLHPIVNATAFSTSNAVEGVRIFNGDGTGTLTGTAVTTTERPTPGPTGYPTFAASASSNTFSGSFTYTINSDGTFTVQLAEPQTGTFLTGPRTGQTFSIDTIPLTGLISKDGNTLTLASVAPTVETITFFTSGVAGDVWPRICHRARVHIKLD
jgi:hypothetical protein